MQAPTFDSRGHAVPLDARRQRVTAVTTLWDTVPTNRMPHVPYPRMRWPQAQAFDTPHLAKGAPFKRDEPLMARAAAQGRAMAVQKGAAEAASEAAVEGALPEGAREREKVFKEWRQTHGAAL